MLISFFCKNLLFFEKIYFFDYRIWVSLSCYTTRHPVCSNRVTFPPPQLSSKYKPLSQAVDIATSTFGLFALKFYALFIRARRQWDQRLRAVSR